MEIKLSGTPNELKEFLTPDRPVPKIDGKEFIKTMSPYLKGGVVRTKSENADENLSYSDLLVDVVIKEIIKRLKSTDNS